MVLFSISTAFGFLYTYAVISERTLSTQQDVKAWFILTDAVSSVALIGWLICLAVWLYQGLPYPQLSPYLNLLIAISIIQRNEDSSFWKTIGYVLTVLAVVVLMTGCVATPKVEDTVVPAGAITVNVPVPTCGDDLSNLLFADTHRPPSLPINNLTAADKQDYELVYQAYIQTVQILTEYSVALERDRTESQMQCKAIRSQVDTLNTKTPVIPVEK